MAEFPALPLWTDAFIGDTYQLTPAECGAYIRLLMAAWRSPDCRLPNDDKLLGRIAGDTRNWRRLKPTVMAFWDLSPDGLAYTQKRLRREYDYVSRKSANARSSANARWLKNNDPPNANASSEHMRNACASDAPTPTPKIEEPSADALGQIGGADPPPVQSASQWIYAKGKELLSAAAKPSKNPGGMISKWLREHGEDAVMSALKACDAKRTPEPIAFINGVLRQAEKPKARQTEAGMRRDRQNTFFDNLNAKLDAMEEPDVPRPCAPMLADRSENAFDVSAPDGPRAGSLCGGNDPAFGRIPGRDD